MSRFLFATWDGAGNLVPTLALAARLSGDGHDVRLLGQRSIQARCGSQGWRFRPVTHTPDFDSAAPAPARRDMRATARQLWFNPAAGEDLREELAREPADIVIGDCMLFGALAAAQAAALPTVALFHGAYALFRRGPLFDMLNGFLPELNALRQDLELPAIRSISELHDACAMSLVATPEAFEPEMPRAANVRFAGPMLDGPALLHGAGDTVHTSTSQPLVIVSFSTSDQGQLAVLQRVVTAAARVASRVIVTTGPAIDPSSVPSAANVDIVRFVPHARLLPAAALVITHAGLGTVMTALAHGVPLLCVPLGRDQFFNAARVEALGAGRTIGADADADTIGQAIRALLRDETARAAAKRMADAITVYRNGESAIAELAALARSQSYGDGSIRRSAAANSALV